MKQKLVIVVLLALCLLFVIQWQTSQPSKSNIPENKEKQNLILGQKAKSKSLLDREVGANQKESSNGNRSVQSLISSNDMVITDTINRLLKNKHRYPTVQDVDMLTDKDEPILIRLFQQETELTNKMSLVWALAAVGKDNAFRAIRNILEAEYNQKNLDTKEYKVMANMLICLGFIASRSEEAFSFLNDASNVDFWNRRTWRREDPRSEAYVNHAFAGNAIRSLAISGRLESPEIIESAFSMDWKDIHERAGYFCEAAYSYEYVKTYGVKSLLDRHLCGTKFRDYEKWIKSGNGKKWHEWAVDMSKKR